MSECSCDGRNATLRRTINDNSQLDVAKIDIKLQTLQDHTPFPVGRVLETQLNRRQHAET